MSLLGAEVSNLMHALRLARRHQRWSDITGILSGLNRLLTMQGRRVEKERLIADLEAEATGADDEPITGREDLWIAPLGHRSEIAQYRRDFASAQTITLRLKDYYERAADDHNQAVALHQLGIIAQERRQFEEAERWYRQSLAIEERIGNEHGQAMTLHQLGRIAEERGNAAEAVRFYKRAEALLVRLNDSYSLEVVRTSLQRVRRGSHDKD
jgi:tetratricopeptide (TPR) repeat protein